MSQPVTPAQPNMGQPANKAANFNRPGAIDLSRLAPQPAAPQNNAAAGGSGSYTVQVTEAQLNDVIQQSLTYPVILTLISAQDPGCVSLCDTLTRLSDGAAGHWLLAIVDVDAQPRIAQALRVNAVPTVLALIGGQAMPLFQGTADETQIRQVLEQVLASAVANGIAGRVTPATRSDAEGPDPRFADADAAMMSGDYNKAIEEFKKLLAVNPKDSAAEAGVATATMLSRCAALDPTEAVAASQADPNNIDLAFAASDVDMISGQAARALNRLIDLIRINFGDDRERIRTRVLELFATIDQTDPDLLAARRALGAALY